MNSTKLYPYPVHHRLCAFFLCFLMCFQQSAGLAAPAVQYRVSGIESARDVTFSLDCATMYLATTGAGNIWAIPMDTEFNQAGEATELAKAVGNGTWHDGIGIDACGNVYVPDYSRSGLYRVAPDGTVTTIYAGKPKLYGHGLKWGNGVGGWRRDALYLPQPYDSDTVREVVIGVPQGEWTCAQ